MLDRLGFPVLPGRPYFFDIKAALGGVSSMSILVVEGIFGLVSEFPWRGGGLYYKLRVGIVRRVCQAGL